MRRIVIASAFLSACLVGAVCLSNCSSRCSDDVYFFGPDQNVVNPDHYCSRRQSGEVTGMEAGWIKLDCKCKEQNET